MLGGSLRPSVQCSGLGQGPASFPWSSEAGASGWPRSRPGRRSRVPGREPQGSTVFQHVNHVTQVCISHRQSSSPLSGETWDMKCVTWGVNPRLCQLPRAASPARLGSFCFVVRLWQGVGIICFLNAVSLFPVVSSQVCDPERSDVLCGSHGSWWGVRLAQGVHGAFGPSSSGYPHHLLICLGHRRPREGGGSVSLGSRGGGLKLPEQRTWRV